MLCLICNRDCEGDEKQCSECYLMFHPECFSLHRCIDTPTLEALDGEENEDEEINP